MSALIEVLDPKYYFYTVDRHTLRNIYDFVAYMHTCTPEVYAHHVTDARNDFADWIAYVLFFPKLAMKIRPIKKVEQCLEVVTAFMVKYEYYYSHITPDKYFLTDDHYSIRSLNDLYFYLHYAPSGSFEKHVHGQTTDFVAWIRDVLGFHELAQKLEAVTILPQFVSLLHDFIIHYHYADDPNEKIDDGVLNNIIASKTMHAVSAENFLVKQYTDQELEKFSTFSKVSKNTSLDIHHALPDIDALKTRFLELKSKIQELRRAQKNPLIPDLLTRTFASKLEYYTITQDPQDCKKIILLLDELEKEIMFCAEEKIVDVKKELAEMMLAQHTAPVSPNVSGVVSPSSVSGITPMDSRGSSPS